MQYSNTTTKAGLVEDIDFFALSDSTSYPLTDKTRNANRHYYKAVVDVLKVTGVMGFNDSENSSSAPVETKTLVDSQQTYNPASDFLSIDAIEVKNAAGTWVRLTQIDKFAIPGSITDYKNTPGMPDEYDIDGNVITLYPAPSSSAVTLTNGMKIYYRTEITLFASTDTTPEPSIPEPFHRIISLGAAYDYLIVHGPQDRADRIRQEYEQLRSELRENISNRNKDIHIGIRPAHRGASYE